MLTQYENNLYQRNHIAELRKKVYSIFGDKCNNCGITDPDILVIDHIEPIGKTRKLTTGVYYDILRDTEKAKLEYQLLCHNCNWKKRITNNENHKEESFAYKQDIEAVWTKLRELENKINSKDTNTKVEQQPNFTLEELGSMINTYQALFIVDGIVSARNLRYAFHTKLGLDIGHNKAYELKTYIENKYNEGKAEK